MTPPDEAHQRLADLMEDRRADLRLRWEDVARAGGISVKAVHDARSGNSDPRRNTLRGIDAGLQWAPGSAERVLAGGSPEPLSDEPGTDLGAVLRNRRIYLDPGYIDRRLFARDRGIDFDFATAIETGRQTKFTEAEKAIIEAAYETVLPDPDGQPPEPQPEPDPHEDDPQLGRLVHLWRRMDDRQRAIVMAVAEATAAPAPAARRYGT